MPRSTAFIVLALVVVYGQTTLAHEAGRGSPVGGFAGVATGASPVPTTDLELWLRSDTGVVTTNDAVDQWIDQSPNGVVFSASGDARPTRGRAPDVGVPVVRFDGVDDQLDGGLNTTLGETTIFALFRYAEVHSSNNYLYTFGADTGAGSQMTLSRRSSDEFYHFDGSAANSTPCLPPGAFQMTTQFFGLSSPEDHDLYRDQSLVLSSSSANPYSADLTTMVLGNYSSGGFRFRGDLVEILVYSRTVEGVERSQIEEYLLAKRTDGLMPAETSDLSSWTVEQYEFAAQPDAVWDPCSSRVVVQEQNADASLLVSDAAASDNKMVTGFMGTADGPDFMGFAFAYQGRDRYYLFDWKQTTASFFGEEAELGLSLRVVDVPGGGDPAGSELWDSDDSANVTTLRDAAIPYVVDDVYWFRLVANPGYLVLDVWDTGGNRVIGWRVQDSSLVGGKFAFYDSSLADAYFGGVREIEHIFFGDFEVGDTSRWSTAVP